VVVAAGITRAGCWAHARRKFVDVQDLSPQIAREALALIDRLFAIEQQAKELSDAERLSLRQSQSRPIVTALHDRLLRWKQSLLPKHPTTLAINYVLNQWRELNQFLADGAVPIGRVEMWRGGLGPDLSVDRPFRLPVPHESGHAPFPHPAHRTGRAALPHPALTQNFRPSLSSSPCATRAA